MSAKDIYFNNVFAKGKEIVVCRLQQKDTSANWRLMRRTSK